MEPNTELTPLQIELITFVAKGNSLAQAVEANDGEIDRLTVINWCRTN